MCSCCGALQALLNLGSSDPSLRSAAYNLLCALTQTFDLKIEGQLLETNGMLATLQGYSSSFAFHLLWRVLALSAFLTGAIPKGLILRKNLAFVVYVLCKFESD